MGTRVGTYGITQYRTHAGDLSGVAAPDRGYVARVFVVQNDTVVQQGAQFRDKDRSTMRPVVTVRR